MANQCAFAPFFNSKHISYSPDNYCDIKSIDRNRLIADLNSEKVIFKIMIY